MLAEAMPTLETAACIDVSTHTVSYMEESKIFFPEADGSDA